MKPLQKIDRDMLTACENARFDLLQKYMEKGAQVNAEDLGKWTPLNWTIAYQDVEKSMFLLDKGANIEHRTNNGRTPFSYAVTGGNIALVQVLLQYGANQHASDEMGYTPLIYAIMSQNAEITQLLLKNGARVTDRDKQGKSVFQHAKESSPEVRILVQDAMKKFHQGQNGGKKKNKKAVSRTLLMKIFLTGYMLKNACMERFYRRYRKSYALFNLSLQNQGRDSYK